VFLEDLQHTIQWGKKQQNVRVRLVLSGVCCEGAARTSALRSTIEAHVLFAVLDSAQDGGVAALKRAIKEAVLSHLQATEETLGGMGQQRCNLFLDADREIPSWSLQLICDSYARQRDDTEAAKSRKRDREGDRKVDHAREWLDDPSPKTSTRYYYTTSNQSTVQRHRDYEALQKQLHKSCKGSMPKVKRLFQQFARDHGWDLESLMSFERRDRVHRALDTMGRVSAVVARIRSQGGATTTKGAQQLSVIVGSLCPVRDDPGRSEEYLSKWLCDLGIKRHKKLQWVRVALNRRWTFDEHDALLAELPPTIQEGEAVVVRGGEAELVHRCEDTGKITVRYTGTGGLMSFGSEGRSGARMRRALPSLLLPKRKPIDDRSVRADLRRSVMEDYLLKENYQSPNKKDVVRRLVGYNTKEEKIIVWRMVPWGHIVEGFSRGPYTRGSRPTFFKGWRGSFSGPPGVHRSRALVDEKGERRSLPLFNLRRTRVQVSRAVSGGASPDTNTEGNG
jgi:hypothetical protein